VKGRVGPAGNPATAQASPSLTHPHPMMMSAHDVIPNPLKAGRDRTSVSTVTAAGGDYQRRTRRDGTRPATMPLRTLRKVPHRAFGPVRDDRVCWLA